MKQWLKLIAEPSMEVEIHENAVLDSAGEGNAVAVFRVATKNGKVIQE